jgi:hypothetical protein
MFSQSGDAGQQYRFAAGSLNRGPQRNTFLNVAFSRKTICHAAKTKSIHEQALCCVQ